MFLNLCATLITVTLTVTCLLLILIVLMQRPRQEGLSPVFGHSITDHCWGPQTATILHKGTVWLGILLFALSLSLSLVKSAQAREAGALSMPDTSALETNPAPAR